MTDTTTTIDKLRTHLHALSNLIQVVMGYAEMDECEKAVPHAKLAGKEIQKIAHLLDAHNRKKKGDGLDVP